MAAGWAISGAMAGISRSVIKVHNEQGAPLFWGEGETGTEGWRRQESQAGLVGWL